MTIGESMRQLREENGYSLKQVEDKIGINNGNLSRYERDLNFPSIEWCIRLADLYGVSVDELVGRLNNFDKVTVQNRPAAPSPLPEDEQQLLALYRKMTHSQKIRVVAYSEGLLSTGTGAQIPKNLA